MARIQKEADRYLRNRRFFQELRDLEMKGMITQKQRIWLRDMAISGDETGAHKALGILLLEARHEE